MMTMSAVTMSAVWDRTGEFIRDHPAALVAIAGLGLFLPVAASEIVRLSAPGMGSGGQLGLSVVKLALSLIGVLGQIAIVGVALDPAGGVGGAWRQAGQRFGPFIGVSVAMLAVTVLAVLPVIVTLVGNGVDLTPLSNGVAPTLAGAAGWQLALYVVVVVPLGLWLMARLLPLAGVIVAERRGFGAFGRAFALTRGLALRIVGVLLLYLIVSWVAAMAARTVVGSVLRLAFGAGEGVTVAGVGTAAAVGLVATIFSVLASVFTAQLYLATSERAPAA